jgi:hypothetical protein
MFLPDNFVGLGDRKEPFRPYWGADIRSYRQSLSTIENDCGDNSSAAALPVL